MGKDERLKEKLDGKVAIYNKKITELESEKRDLLKKRDNLVQCSKEIPVLMKTINILLGFFGYKAKASGYVLNQLNIYDLKTNELIEKVEVECPVNFKFTGRDDKEIECIFNCDNDKFDCGDVSCGNTSILLSGGEVWNKYSGIYLIKRDNTSNYALKDLDVGIDCISARIENNYRGEMIGKGEWRSISYYTYDEKNPMPALMREECEKERTYNWVEIDCGGIIESAKWILAENSIKPIKKDDIKIENNSLDTIIDAQFSLVTHPRNKELIEYLINDFDKEYPGIKDFIIKRFPLYNKIMQTEYNKNQILNTLIDRIIDNNCDIKEQEKNLTIVKR